jgi:selenocysteine lyase/cysteine desulfurase
VFTETKSEEITALVRAIRRAYGAPYGTAGVEAFHVHNIHDFARRLVEQGIAVREDTAA